MDLKFSELIRQETKLRGNTISLTCYRCLRMVVMPADTPEQGSTNARIAKDEGWRVRNGKAVCPRCP